MKYDVVVIGGGIVGSAILHNLSKYNLDVLLVEKEPDLAEGISKGNSAILHTGFDAPPNSTEAEAIQRSRKLWPEFIQDHNLMYEHRGAVMVALNEEEKDIITDKYLENARINEVDVEWITREEVLERNPVVNKDNIGGLLIEDEGIVDPWEAVYKFAEVAENNGAEVRLEAEVTAIQVADDKFTLEINNKENIAANYIVNAAGLFADDIARMVGDDSFTITPRKGQFIVTKSKVDINNIILPVPTPTSKGKLIIPAVFKGHLLGPTAEDHSDKFDVATNETGFEEIRKDTSKLVPESLEYHSVKQYAANRSVSTEGDFIIRPSKAEPQLIHAAGIRSTGLSAAPGIAELVLEELSEQGLALVSIDDWNSKAPVRPGVDDEEIICLTRNITKGEIKAVLSSNVFPRNIDGIKRRTTVILGECQGVCCIPKIMDILDEMNLENNSIKNMKGSQIGIKI